MFNLKDKVALITGASSGIGEGITKLMHKLGAKVILSGTNAQNLQNLSNELGNNNHILTCNLKDHERVETLFDEALKLQDKIDILICNAGITKDNLAMRMKLEDFENVIDVNLTSNFILNKAAIKHMIKNKYGRIINMASVIATLGNAGQANYAASKGGLIAMTKSIAQEVASRNITVNAVAPGFIETAMTNVLSESHKENLLKSIPAGRMGHVDDIAQAVAFLASDMASYITGQTIHINGGMLMV